MNLNRTDRRKLKKNIAPLARKIAQLEKQIKNKARVEEAEAEMERIFNSLSMFEMFAIEDYITSKNLLDK